MRGSPAITHASAFARRWIGEAKQALALCTVIYSGACARIDPASSPYLERFDEIKSAESAHLTARVPVYLTVQFVRGRERHAESTIELQEALKRRLGELGFAVASSKEEAVLEVACSIREWWASAGTSALIGFLTLSVYTPFYFPWVIEVNIVDSAGTPAGDLYEKGEVSWHSFGTLFIPTTIAQYFALVPEQMNQLADEAARITAAKIHGIAKGRNV